MADERWFTLPSLNDGDVPTHACVVEDVSAPTLCASTSKLATYTWPAATALAQWIVESDATLWAGRRVLEMGSGTGLVGIVAALRGAQHVTFSDADEAALHCVRLGIRRNSIDARGVSVVRLAWGEAEALELIGGLHPFDTVLGADVLYDSAQFLPLLQTVKAALLRHRSSCGTAADPTPASSSSRAASFITAYHIRSITRDISPLLSWLGLKARLLPMPRGVPVAGSRPVARKSPINGGNAAAAAAAAAADCRGADDAIGGAGGSAAAKRPRLSRTDLAGRDDTGFDGDTTTAPAVLLPRGGADDDGFGSDGEDDVDYDSSEYHAVPSAWEAVALIEIKLV